MKRLVTLLAIAVWLAAAFVIHDSSTLPHALVDLGGVGGAAALFIWLWPG